MKHAAVVVVLSITPLAGLAGGCELLDYTGPKQESGFEVDADGWTIAGDAQADSVVPDYSGVGGNPDGLISANDEVTGGVWFFVAPERYRGDNSDIAGRSLGFDLKVDQAPPNPFDDIDVLLRGNDVTLVFDTTDNPIGEDWTSYLVPLVADGWTRDVLGGEPATEGDMAAVLSNTEELRIRGEFNDGPDTGFLDNVLWGTL